MKKTLIFCLIAAMMLTMAACGVEAPRKTVDLQALYDTCLDSMTEMMPLEGDTRVNFLGLAEEDCTQVYTAIAADGMITDEIWLVEAKDQEAFDRISALADARLKAKGEETISYAPEQYAVVEKAQIVKSGLYLALLVAPEVDTLKAAAEAAFN